MEDKKLIERNKQFSQSNNKNKINNSSYRK